MNGVASVLTWVAWGNQALLGHTLGSLSNVRDKCSIRVGIGGLIIFAIHVYFCLAAATMASPIDKRLNLDVGHITNNHFFNNEEATGTTVDASKPKTKSGLKRKWLW